MCEYLAVIVVRLKPGCNTTIGTSSFLSSSDMRPTQMSHNSSGGSPMDIDMDSPFSPGSASDLSDLFEPPSASPPSSSLPKIARNSKSRKSDRQKTWQNVLGRSDKNGRNGHSTTPKKAV